jgi:hypothetical protein
MKQFSESEYRRLVARNPRSGAQYKGRCRAECARAGEPAPSWATAPAPFAVARHSNAAPATATERDFTAKSPTIVDEHAVLRAPGRVLALSSDGAVHLLEWHNGSKVEARFPTVAAAVAAVQSGAIAWRLVRRAKPVQQTNSMRLNAS